ncbi:GMC oxidoreductase [Methanothermococcus sp.]|uniref:GMC oxidoreductase n=1 Tax=Methanothermococcus sp. TaxID=2614238 RepID=UPI0025F555D2|nr:GMC oxidoreductase [Methanothermococcus sp.]
MYDIIIIGSGVGGSTIFKELNNKYPNKKIILLEKGKVPQYIVEGNTVKILYLNSLGGSAVYSVGNGIKIDLKHIGVNNSIYYEIEKELNITPVPMEFINETTKKLFDYGFKQTPKFIDFNKCNSCGNCASKLCCGKWTPLDFLKYKNENSRILCNFKVSNIKKENGFFYIEGFDKNNNKKIIEGKIVIVSAGGINSPRILSSILDNEHLGKNLFIDTFITVGGILDGVNLNKSIPMSVYKKYDGFLLSPHYSMLLYDEIKKENRGIRNNDIFSLMIKIRDENKGVVGKDYVYKNITEKDEALLSKGFKEALNILSDMGINKAYKTIPRGSHPSGTCAIGKVINKDFETEIDNLFVCDASVFPEPLGLPPILGIIAIGKKLANLL